MYYTDSELYYKLQEGVPARVLAELNGCSIADIKRAASNYALIVNRRDSDYQKLVKAKEQMCDLVYNRANYSKSEPKIITSSTIQTKEVIKMVRGKRFNYTEAILDAMRDKLEQGCSVKAIYNEIFANKSDSKPSFQGFKKKCDTLKNDCKKSNKGDLSIKNSSNLAELKKAKKQIESSIYVTQNKYKDLIYKLAKVDLLIEQHEAEQ